MSSTVYWKMFIFKNENRYVYAKISQSINFVYIYWKHRSKISKYDSKCGANPGQSWGNLATNLPTTKGSAARAERLCRQTHRTFSMETYVGRQLEDQVISLFPVPWPLTQAWRSWVHQTNGGWVSCWPSSGRSWELNKIFRIVESPPEIMAWDAYFSVVGFDWFC